MRSTRPRRPEPSPGVSTATGLLTVLPILSLFSGPPPQEVALASAAGSELPWWTPLAISLLLVAVSLVYRWRDRRRGPPDGLEEGAVKQKESLENGIGGNGGRVPGHFQVTAW